MTIEFEIVRVEGEPSDVMWARLVHLNDAIFDFREPEEQLSRYLSSFERSLTLFAFDGANPIGFKTGFECEPSVFESWRGGVLEAYRRRGAADALMRAQHAWCVGEGFERIRSYTSATNAPMLALNARHGFRVVERRHNAAGVLKFVQEKDLMAPEITGS